MKKQIIKNQSPLKPLFLLLILAPTLINCQIVYTTTSCTATNQRTEAFCQNYVPNSCCANVNTITTASNGAKTTTTTQYCLPIDLVSGLASVSVSSTLSYTMSCISQVSTTSDKLYLQCRIVQPIIMIKYICTSGSDPCATISNACCAQRSATINGAAVTKTLTSFCALRSFVPTYTYFNGTNSGKINVTYNCMDSVSYYKNQIYIEIKTQHQIHLFWQYEINGAQQLKIIGSLLLMGLISFASLLSL